MENTSRELAQNVSGYTLLKPKILLITDVYGWGGHERGLMIKKYLSDEFEFTLIDRKEFSNNFNTYKSNYDIYYPLFHTMLISKLFNKIPTKKLTTVITGSTPFKKVFRNDNKLKERLNICKKVFVNNKKAERQLVKIIKDDRVCYVPRGVDANIFYKKNFNKNKKLTVVYVGKPVHEKGLNIITNVCKDTGIELIKNTRNFKTALSKDEMCDLYNKCHLYIVASTIDGTPNPALEAAACGRMIVSNNIGNMPEFIKEGWNGFIVNRHESKYKELLNKIKNRMDYIEYLGENARKEILNNWTWEITLNRYERPALRSMLNE